jgi:processive 1,2-diacylglycerol beta-glucosyltransferase
MDRSEVFPRHLWFLRNEMHRLEQRLLADKPEVLCSTFPAYGFMAEALRERGVLRVPFFNIVTDSISINSLWTRPACDGWFVPNPETAAVMAGMGVPEDKLHVSGFPVALFFGDEGRELTPPALAMGARPRVLYMMHSGMRHAEATARLLLEKTDWDLTLAIGRDERLRGRLSKVASGRKAPFSILSWTDQIPRLLLTHHALISKAGGASTQEAITARCPMIVNQIVPGQEEGNYELLRRRDIGARAETPEEVLAALSGAFADGGSALEALARQPRGPSSTRCSPKYSQDGAGHGGQAWHEAE